MSEVDITDTEVQLCIIVPPDLRCRVKMVAKARGLTQRALVLSALRDAGVLENLPEAELTDRRAVLAATKARLWHEHRAANANSAVRNTSFGTETLTDGVV